MKTRKTIYIVLLIALATVIFLFSNQNAKESESVSDGVASKIIDTIQEVTNHKINKEDKSRLINNTRFIIRKLAHFTLYFGLGTLAYLVSVKFSIKKPTISAVLFCFLYACGDEIHQLFLDGRTAKILDVCIDTCGSSLAVICLFHLQKFKKSTMISKIS